MKPVVSVIVVTFNSAEHIGSCLESVQKNLKLPHQIIVVDNNSSDATIPNIQRSGIKVELIKSDQNLGFSRANNKAVKVAEGEYLFFLNPDTELLDQKFELLVEYLKTHPDVGLVAPKLNLSNGQVQTSVKVLPTLGKAIQEYWFGKKGVYSEYAPKGETPVEVEAVYGAAMVISKQFYNQIGGFNNKYFLYYEDLDLCRRVHQFGKKIVYIPEVVLIHQLGSSTKQIQQKKSLPGVRTLAHFLPLKSSGSNYYQITSGNLYHGVLIAFLIRMVIYLGTKLRR